MKKLIFVSALAFFIVPMVVFAGTYFTDVADNHKNIEAIAFMKNKGIISGYSDGTFKPDNPVNRAELMKIVINSNPLDFDAEKYNITCFSDVVKGEWYTPYICYAKDKEWISGYKDGTFAPSKTVNKVEALKIIMNAYGFYRPDSVDESSIADVAASDWFAPFTERAYQLGLIDLDDSGNFYPGNDVTRAEVSQLIYNMIVLAKEDIAAVSGEVSRVVSGETGR